MKGLDKKRVEDMIDLLLDYKKVLDRAVDDESLAAVKRKEAKKESLGCEKMLQDLSQLEDNRIKEFIPLLKMALKSILSFFVNDSND